MKGGDEMTEFNVTVEQFGIKISLARLAAGRMNQTELAKRVKDAGYGCTSKTIERWEHGRIKNINLGMITALSKATGQTTAYFLGLEPLNEDVLMRNFRLGPVVQQSDYQAPVEHLQGTRPWAYLDGEPGGARTLDTRIKSKGRNKNTKKIQSIDSVRHQDYSLTAQDFGNTM